MKIVDQEQLEFLHDAALLDLCFEFRPDGERRLILRAMCDEDCGYEEWNGRLVSVILAGLTLTTVRLFGHVAGPEFINSFAAGVSAQTSSALEELKAAGIAIAEFLLTLSLQSGSEVELACESVEVVVAQ
jgi:hypothetical protein